MRREPSMPKLLTTAQIARQCGISTAAVHARAGVRKIKPVLVAGRTKLWSAQAAARLKIDYGRGRAAVKMWREIRGEKSARGAA